MMQSEWQNVSVPDSPMKIYAKTMRMSDGVTAWRYHLELDEDLVRSKTADEREATRHAMDSLLRELTGYPSTFHLDSTWQTVWVTDPEANTALEVMRRLAHRLLRDGVGRG